MTLLASLVLGLNLWYKKKSLKMVYMSHLNAIKLHRGDITAVAGNYYHPFSVVDK